MDGDGARADAAPHRRFAVGVEEERVDAEVPRAPRFGDGLGRVRHEARGPLEERHREEGIHLGLIGDFGHGLEVVVAEPVEARRLQVAEVVVDRPRAGVEQLVRVDVHEPLEPVARLGPPEAVERVEHLPHLDVVLHVILQGRPAGEPCPRLSERVVANDHLDIRVAARRLDVRGLRRIVEVQIDPRKPDPLMVPYEAVQALRGVS